MVFGAFETQKTLRPELPDYARTELGHPPLRFHESFRDRRAGDRRGAVQGAIVAGAGAQQRPGVPEVPAPATLFPRTFFFFASTALLASVSRFSSGHFSPTQMQRRRGPEIVRVDTKKALEQ